MKNKLRILFDFFSTDGFKNTISMIYTFLSRQLGISISETYFYISSFDKEIKFNKNELHSQLEGNFHIASNFNDLKEFDNMPRYNYLPIENWFLQGSKCYLFELNGEIIAYVWSHIKKYEFDGNIFYLDDNEVWVGPSFVSYKYRRKRIYNFLMYRQFNYLKSENYKSIYTCCNSEKIPAIKVCKKSGFKIIGVLRERKFLGTIINKQVLDFDIKNILTSRLK